MKHVISLIFFLLLLITQLTGAQKSPDVGLKDSPRSYITFMPGTMPLIISIPHGGYLMPDEIPERTCVNCAKNQDIYTLEIGLGIREVIHDMTGHLPFVIINNLHRTRLDPNRNIDEAAAGNPDAEEAWHQFQDFIDTASAIITREYGRGLFIDLHGHRHLIKRTELGYLLSGEELQYEDEILDLGTLTEYTSIRNLVAANNGSLSFSQLLRGPLSLGSMLCDLGYSTVPSPEIPYPQAGEPYFSGGYNTTRHGSSTGGTIDGIQIELDMDLRSDLTRRDTLITDIAIVLIKYLRVHYFPESAFSQVVDDSNK